MARRDQADAFTFIGASISIPPVLDTPGLCRWLKTSPSHVDRLLAEGLPYLELGFPKGEGRTRHERRYEPAAVLEWLRGRGKAQA